MKKLILLAVICVIAGCNHSRQPEIPTAGTSERLKNMKGFEIYVWSLDGKTLYTLLPGTNRNKDSAEIYDQSSAMEWNEMKKTLDRIDTGEYVTIKPLKADSERVTELREYLRSKSVVVSE